MARVHIKSVTCGPSACSDDRSLISTRTNKLQFDISPEGGGRLLKSFFNRIGRV